MADLFTLDNLFTFFMLTALQAVLGFDNLLYISIESKRVREDKQAMVRKIGIGLAILLRLVLLFGVMSAIQYFQTPFFSLHWEGIVEGEVNVHAFIVLLGGAFIIYTAVKEIMHMLAIDDLEGQGKGKGMRTVGGAIFWIVVMNLIFSFDSILSAMALTNVFMVMAAAIIVSGLGMIYLADRVSDFLHKNRMYEVLGLFVLFIVGIMLVSEGGHLAHLSFFGYKVEAMAKSTFYFVLAVLVIVDIVQGRYQKKLLAQRQREMQANAQANA
ncbi:MAG: tellurium resistance protein TerC [Cohaesibacter sp.]|nr:tellurium resistance protein TerC [Cohaesibacter sp.]